MSYNIETLSSCLYLIGIKNKILLEQEDAELYFFEVEDFKDLIFKIKDKFYCRNIGIFDLLKIDDNLYSIYIKQIKKKKINCLKCDGKGYFEFENMDLMFQTYKDKKKCYHCDGKGYNKIF